MHASADVDAIHAKIISWMLNGEWGHHSYARLMEEHPERSLNYLREMASNASRHIRLSLDKDEVRQFVHAYIDRGMKAAFEAEAVAFDQTKSRFHTYKRPDLRAVATFSQQIMELYGLTERDPKRPPPESVDVPIDELRRVLGAAGWEITKKENTDERSEETAG